ncbi:MAG TPA: NfeD family protein [Nitrolancea sp.]|nr:NfeD family protein [Nitrolancea sp.]
MASLDSVQHTMKLMCRLLFAVFAASLFGIVGQSVASADAPLIYAIHVNGVINSLTSNNVIQTLNSAEQNRATALLIEINSPGGTESAVQDITRALLSATIPVIVYVNGVPKGEALSGALFITLAGNLAAVSPTVKLGAGNPESLGVNPSGDQQQRLSQSVAFATNIASARQRNVTALTSLITQNDELTANEAVSQGLVDTVSPNIEALLSTINGEKVQTLAGSATIQSENARLIWQKPSWHARILQQITDPNVAYLLFSLGALLLVIELIRPGRLIAGVPGIVALAASFVAFGNMPVSWLAVSLMTIGYLLMIRELFTPKFQFLGPIGIVLYLIGSFTLYRPVRETSAIVPAVGVTWWVIASSTAIVVVAMLIMMRRIARVRHGDLAIPAASIVGSDAVVSQTLQPRGFVRLHGQEWTAVSDGTTIDEGEHVRIGSVDAGVLHVTPYDEQLWPVADSAKAISGDKGNSRRS